MPISHYFKRATAWVPANRMSFEDIREGCRQAADQGMLGVVTECDPGFYQTTNLWHDYDIPYDGQELCYRVKQFAFNLFSWDRDLSVDDLRQALHRKFFDPLVPEEMAAALMALAEKVREISWAWQGRYWPIKSGGDTVEEWVEKRDRRYWEGTLRRLRDEQSLWQQLPAFLDEVGVKIRNCQAGTSRRARRTLAGMRDILLDIQGPVLGPERFLCPRVAPSERDPFPIMALAREAEDWIPRIEAALARRKD